MPIFVNSFLIHEKKIKTLFDQLSKFYFSSDAGGCTTWNSNLKLNLEYRRGELNNKIKDLWAAGRGNFRSRLSCLHQMTWTSNGHAACITLVCRGFNKSFSTFKYLQWLAKNLAIWAIYLIKRLFLTKSYKL